MANSKSAEKRIRTHERNRLANRAVRTRFRNQIRRFREAVDGGDLAAAERLLAETHAIIARTAHKGVIHSRTASRHVSRLASLLNARRSEAPTG